MKIYELDCFEENRGRVGDDVNICNEFDNFMRELFEVEPPLGKFDSNLES